MKKNKVIVKIDVFYFCSAVSRIRADPNHTWREVTYEQAECRYYSPMALEYIKTNNGEIVTYETEVCGFYDPATCCCMNDSAKKNALLANQGFKRG